MKWIPLSVFAVLCMGVSWGCMNNGWTIPAGMSGAVMLVLAVTAFAEFVTKYADDAADIFERRMKAKYTSPVVMIAEAISHLHPEHMKLLYRFTARAVWDVRVDVETGERDVMLRGTNIHLGFVEYILNNSRNGKLYALNSLSDGSKAWDPDKLVTDYEQYREFELWLSTRLIVIRHYDNAPAVFLPPWTPALVKEAIGIKEHIEYYAPPVKRIAKPLSDVEKALPKKPVDVPEKPLTDDELANIEAIRKAREQRYGVKI